MKPPIKIQIAIFASILLLQCCPPISNDLNHNGSADGTQVNPNRASRLADNLESEEIYKFEFKNSSAITWYFNTKYYLQKHHSDPNIKLKGGHSKISIRYQLIDDELSDYHATLDVCDIRKSPYLRRMNPAKHERVCRNHIHTFTPLLNASDAKPENYCEPRTTNADITDEEPKNITISNLLPNQAYEFDITLGLIGTKTELVCLPEGAPLYPPQADLSSFSKISEESDDGGQAFNLFWRPVPKIFVSSSLVEYEINCKDDRHPDDQKTHLEDHDVGSTRVDKSTNISHISCEIRSKLNNNYSPAFSLVMIPSESHMIKLGPDFKFHVYAVSNEEYLLEWTPFDFDPETRRASMLRRNITHGSSITNNGTFSIFWCNPGRKSGCSKLDGVVRTNSSSNYNLILPEESEVAHRIFGIAYAQAGYSTGIIWSKCAIGFNHQFASEQINIDRALETVDDHSVINLGWHFSHCDSQVAIVETYEINYCKVSELAGCSSIWYDHAKLDLEKFKFSNRDGGCQTISVSNQFITEANISGLAAASVYVIRVKYTMADGQANKWSDPIVAKTRPDPAIVSSCWNRYRFYVVMTPIVFGAVMAFCYLRVMIWWTDFMIIKRRFLRVRENIVDYVGDIFIDDGPTAQDRARWANELPLQDPDGQSEISLDISDQQGETSFKVDTKSNDDGHENGNEPMNQVFDYIPMSLVEKTSTKGDAGDKETVKLVDESEQDDISINLSQLDWNADLEDGIENKP